MTQDLSNHMADLALSYSNECWRDVIDARREQKAELLFYRAIARLPSHKALALIGNKRAMKQLRTEFELATTDDDLQD